MHRSAVASGACRDTFETTAGSEFAGTETTSTAPLRPNTATCSVLPAHGPSDSAAAGAVTPISRTDTPRVSLTDEPAASIASFTRKMACLSVGDPVATIPLHTQRPCLSAAFDVFDVAGPSVCSDGPVSRGSAVTHARFHTHRLNSGPRPESSSSSSAVSCARCVTLGIVPSAPLRSDTPMDIIAPNPQTPTKGAPSYPGGGSTSLARRPLGTIASSSLILYVGAVAVSYRPLGCASIPIPSHFFSHSEVVGASRRLRLRRLRNTSTCGTLNSRSLRMVGWSGSSGSSSMRSSTRHGFCSPPVVRANAASSTMHPFGRSGVPDASNSISTGFVAIPRLLLRLAFSESTAMDDADADPSSTSPA